MSVLGIFTQFGYTKVLKTKLLSSKRRSKKPTIIARQQFALYSFAESNAIHCTYWNFNKIFQMQNFEI